MKTQDPDTEPQVPECRPLPWQVPLWRLLQQARAQGRPPHALLLHGPPGMGKAHFARLLAQSALCGSPDEEGLPCGHCRDCRLFAAGNHPDLLWLEPPADKTQIHVDQVRAIGEFLALKPQYGRAQCVVLQPAEALNESAANSLLKTLEEPTPGALLMLVTPRPAALAATIRSRCQHFLFAPPATGTLREQALAWLRERLPQAGAEGEWDATRLLELAGGAPLAALRLAQEGGLEVCDAVLQDLERLAAGEGDPLETAEKWLKSDAKASLYWLYRWTAEVLRLRLGRQVSALGRGRQARLAQLVQGLDARRLFRLLDAAAEALRLLDRQLNETLLLESLCIDWYETLNPRR